MPGLRYAGHPGHVSIVEEVLWQKLRGRSLGQGREDLLNSPAPS